MISIDTLVPGRMSTYGNPRITTPTISGLAGDGLVFTRAYSQSSTTMMSIPSMLSGSDPSAAEWSYGKRIEFGPG